MKYQAYVILRIDDRNPHAAVTSIDLYSEPSPTQEGNYLQVVFQSAEGDSLAEAYRRAALYACGRLVWGPRNLRKLAERDPNYLGPAMALVTKQVEYMRQGKELNPAIAEEFIATGKVPA